MNNQVKLIDGNKILWELALQGFETDDLKRKMDEGAFDPDTPPVPTINTNWIKYDRDNPPDEGDYLVSDGTYWEKGFMVRTHATVWSVPERGDLLCGDDVKYYARVGVDPVPTIKPGDIIADLLFAYINKDADCPHEFEIKAFEDALSVLRPHFDQIKYHPKLFVDHLERMRRIIGNE